MPWYRLRSGTPYHASAPPTASAELIGDELPDDVFQEWGRQATAALDAPQAPADPDRLPGDKPSAYPTGTGTPTAAGPALPEPEFVAGAPIDDVAEETDRP